jgi:hypothetical protein
VVPAHAPDDAHATLRHGHVRATPPRLPHQSISPPQDTDSAGTKLGGALLNALVFMAVIAAMTFVLFLLFKWGVSRVEPTAAAPLCVCMCVCVCVRRGLPVTWCHGRIVCMS